MIKPNLFGLAEFKSNGVRGRCGYADGMLGGFAAGALSGEPISIIDAALYRLFTTINSIQFLRSIISLPKCFSAHYFPPLAQLSSTRYSRIFELTSFYNRYSNKPGTKQC